MYTVGKVKGDLFWCFHLSYVKVYSLFLASFYHRLSLAFQEFNGKLDASLGHK